jgi:hypothetical protein
MGLPSRTASFVRLPNIVHNQARRVKTPFFVEAGFFSLEKSMIFDVSTLQWFRKTPKTQIMEFPGKLQKILCSATEHSV